MGALIEIPAERFAGRSGGTGKLIWDDVADGLVIRGLLDIQTAQTLIKVVTLLSSPEENERFQHPRMPLIESARFGPLPLVVIPWVESDLFG